MDTILGILPGESYNGIRALTDLSVCVKYTNKLSGAIAREMIAELTSSLAWDFIFYSSFCFTFSFTYGFDSYLLICCTYERVPGATKICRAYPKTWL